MKARKPDDEESGVTLRPLRVTAALEAATAVAFLLWPSLPLTILFGQSPDTALGALAGRIVSAALLALAMACWWAGDDTVPRQVWSRRCCCTTPWPWCSFSMLAWSQDCPVSDSGRPSSFTRRWMFGAS